MGDERLQGHLDRWVIAHDGRPFAYPPFADESPLNVRIRSGERLGHLWGIPLEEEHGGIRGIREGSAEDQISAGMCLPSQFQVLAAQGYPSFDVIGYEFVEE